MSDVEALYCTRALAVRNTPPHTNAFFTPSCRLPRARMGRSTAERRVTFGEWLVALFFDI